jgi:hypothetical protein
VEDVAEARARRMAETEERLPAYLERHRARVKKIMDANRKRGWYR